MAYYSGLCTSYQNLADSLVAYCRSHGWAWQDKILSKDNLFIKINAINNTKGNALAGIILEGGTAHLGDGVLLYSSDTKIRMGSPHPDDLQAIFPANYHLFIFDNEVYLIMKFDYDKFFYLAFGKSGLPHGEIGNGLWLSATACYSARASHPIAIHEEGGGFADGATTAIAPFWIRYSWSKDWSNSLICHGFDGIAWSSGKKQAYASFEPLISRLPTNHFSDSPLLPYNIYLERPENKMSLICQLQNARFIRVDNYENEQIITLGHERWIVFPFYRKNTQERSRCTNYYKKGSSLHHTGTFGWAIRYEG